MRFKAGDKVRYIGHTRGHVGRGERFRPDNPGYPEIGTVGEVLHLCEYPGEKTIFSIQWPKGAIRSAKGISQVFEYALELADESDALPLEPPCNPTWEELTGFGEVV